MILTGISDEAGKDIQTQIKAHQALGWDHLEIRTIHGHNASTSALSDEAFEDAMVQIEAAGMTVAGFGSAIGNWSRKITDDFSVDLEDLQLTVKRMKRANTKYVRTMSWVQGEADESQWRDEGIRRYKELAKIAEGANIYLMYENCTGWASHTADRMVEFVKAVDSPNVVLLYDIGNVVSHGTPDSWDFYQTLRPHLKYVHIKDAKFLGDHVESGEFTYPGEGDALVPRIIADLIATGYDGTISIEPHVATVVHAGGGDAAPEELYEAYLKYARMAGKIVEDAKAAV